jgi:hypothetical protein
MVVTWAVRVRTAPSTSASIHPPVRDHQEGTRIRASRGASGTSRARPRRSRSAPR